MKAINILPFFFLAVTILGCNGNKQTSRKADNDSTINIEGSWTMPNPEDSGGVIGVKLMAGGKAESINMPSLPYSSWQQTGDTVILKGKSIIDNEAENITDTCIVDEYKMSIIGTDIVYTHK